jgi:hypothetical protein
MDIKGIEHFARELNEDQEKIFKTMLIFTLRGIATSKGMECIEKKFNIEPVIPERELKPDRNPGLASNPSQGH